MGSSYARRRMVACQRSRLRHFETKVNQLDFLYSLRKTEPLLFINGFEEINRDLPKTTSGPENFRFAPHPPIIHSLLPSTRLPVPALE